MKRAFAVGAVASAMAIVACGSGSDGSSANDSGGDRVDAAIDSSTVSDGGTDTTDAAPSTDAPGIDTTTHDDSAVDATTETFAETSVIAYEDAWLDGPLPTPENDFYGNFFIDHGTLYWCGLPHDPTVLTTILHSVPASGGPTTDVVTDLQAPGLATVMGGYVYFVDHPPSSSDSVLVRVPLGVGPTSTETIGAFAPKILSLAAAPSDLYFGGEGLVDYLHAPIAPGATLTPAFTEGLYVRAFAFSASEVFWSSDGFVNAGALESSSGLRSVGSGGTPVDQSFHFSAGNLFWLTSSGDLVSLPAAGTYGTASVVLHLDGVTSAVPCAWDGDTFYYSQTSSSDILRVDLSTKTPTLFAKPGTSAGAGAFAFDDTTVYWMDRTGIYRAPK